MNPEVFATDKIKEEDDDLNFNFTSFFILTNLLFCQGFLPFSGVNSVFKDVRLELLLSSLLDEF